MNDHYAAFRRAHGLWVDENNTFHAGVFADSPHAVNMEPASFVGWLAGTEYGDDTAYWETVELSDDAAMEFMDEPMFVLYGEADGEDAYRATEARVGAL